MAVIPYMPMYVADYMADAAHLSTLEHGAYLLLIFKYWQRQTALPADNNRLANLSGLSIQEWTMVRPALAPFFIEENGLWKHKRIDMELAKFFRKSKLAHDAGIKSAESKAKRKSTEAQNLPFDALDSSTDVQRPFNGRSTDVQPKNGRSTDVEKNGVLVQEIYRDTKFNGRSTDVQPTFNYTDTSKTSTEHSGNGGSSSLQQKKENTAAAEPESSGNKGIQNGNGNGVPARSYLGYLGDRGFDAFVKVAFEYWPDLIEEDLQKSWQFTWKRFGINQQLDVVKKLRDRIDAGEPAHFVARPPKYLENGDWKRPPRPPNGQTPQRKPVKQDKPYDPIAKLGLKS